MQPLFQSSLVYLLVWNPPLHTPYISSPGHCLLFARHAHTIINWLPATCFAVVPRLCHLFLVSVSTLSHIHLTILISAQWQLPAEVPSHFLFSFLTGQVSLPCNILLRTQLLWSLPLIINYICILVSSGIICLDFFHPIRILACTTASASPSTLYMSPK